MFNYSNLGLLYHEDTFGSNIFISLLHTSITKKAITFGPKFRTDFTNV